MCVTKTGYYSFTYCFIKLPIKIFILCFTVSLVFSCLAQATLMSGIEAFEQGKYDEAVRILYPLRRAGAIIPFKYLEHMKNQGLAQINDDYASDFEPVPLEGRTLGYSFLQASLAYLELKNNKKKGVEKLEPLILNGNARAISLMEKEFEADKKILNLFKNKQLQKIKDKQDLAKYLKFTNLGPIDLIQCVDISQLFSLNAKDFKLEFNKAIRTFKVNVQKHPNLIGSLAFQVANLDKSGRDFWHFLAFENGEAASCLTLANICLNAAAGKYQKGDYKQLQMNQTEEEALSLFRYYISKVQENSAGDSQEVGKLFLRYGTLLGEGIGGKKDPVTERRYYKMAAKKGVVDAQHNYAFMLEMGEGGDEDLIKARRYYKRAADLGHGDAQLNYALMLLLGDGGDKDPAEARRYFQLAADLGHMMAQYHLAVMLENGEGGDVDVAAALHNYKKAADLGLSQAQYDYAVKLEDDEGRNDPIRRHYFKMAADLGHAGAQNNLAIMVCEGKGGNEDLAGAFLYFEKAAQQGLAIAQHNYACCLWQGFGCKKNPEKAVAYFQKSAAQGHTESLVLMQKLKRALAGEAQENSSTESPNKESPPQKMVKNNVSTQKEELVLENEKFHDDHTMDLSNPKVLRIVTDVFDKNLSKRNLFSPPKRLSLKDITFNIEHNVSTHYMFKGQLFKPSLFESSHKFIREGVLKDIREKLYVSSRNKSLCSLDKLPNPNIAEGFITIHYEEGGMNKYTVIDLNERYLSGKKFLKCQDIEFKKLKRIINAMQDMLDESEKKEIYKLTANKRGIALAKIMEEKVCQQIIWGPWKHNPLDSEAILLLRLVQRLPLFLEQIRGEGRITITGLVLGISSYRDCCPKCQQLIQGFQWAAKDILQNCMDERMRIDDTFGTLAITYGHTRLKFSEGDPEFLNNDVVLKPGLHKLIRCRAPQ